MKRRYWPWTSILAFVFTAIVILLGLIAFSGQLALHRFGRAANVVGMAIFITVAMTVIVLRYRDRYDYYIDADQQTLRRWTPKGEVVVQRENITQIEWFEDSVVVRASTGEIAITKAYAGYGSLRQLVKGW